MAERRMFAKTIIDSDAFLDMPMSARLLYYDLGMRADDDGFVNSPKKIMRTVGATSDDMNILIARKFIIPFDNGVVVIKAWRINNYLRSDRYNETKYLEEKAMLSIDKSGMYHVEKDDGIPDGIPMVDTGKDSIGKDSIGKDSNTTPSGVWDTSKHTNVDNLIHFLNEKGCEQAAYFLEHKDLFDAVKEWMAYKDNRKPKRDNHYSSIDKFLNTVIRNAKSYGVENVIDAISDTMGNNYQGIVWDYAEKYMQKRKNKDDLSDLV